MRWPKKPLIYVPRLGPKIHFVCSRKCYQMVGLFNLQTVLLCAPNQISKLYAVSSNICKSMNRENCFRNSTRRKRNVTPFEERKMSFSTFWHNLGHFFSTYFVLILTIFCILFYYILSDRFCQLFGVIFGPFLTWIRKNCSLNSIVKTWGHL